QYVIKKLNLRNASSRERRAAEQEAQLLSQLKHPNIVTYKESWEGGDGLLYIVMGFCEGGDLYRKLKEQKGRLLPENQVVEWFVQIAMALQYLHEKHILHRDLKTQNVFLTRTNIIKVGDLGIARVLENHCDMASTLIGTPYYMSPELFSNKPYNYKSDVWALGCCVYEMATLKHAFNAKDMNSLVYRIIEGKLPPMPKDYSPELAELIRTMLSKRPEERPSVRSILRQPYIKRQISLFLEATKAKTSKNNIKNGDSKSKPVAAVVPGKAELSHEVVPPQPHSSESSKTYVMGEDKCLFQEKPVVIGPLKVPTSPKDHTYKPDISNTADSLATISRVNIDILPTERRNSMNDGLVQENPPRHLDASNELEGKCNISQVKEMLQENSKSSALPGDRIPTSSSHHVTGERNDPMKPLQPLNKDQNSPKDQWDQRNHRKATSALLEGHLPTAVMLSKGHTNEMTDLVQLMTQTLKLDSKESYEDLLVPDPVSEFKLHRKYRDTLILHGKVTEEAEELHFKELPSAVMPGSEKIRRIVEVLRADVIRGLGIQLLEQVYDILEEEDELEREVHLQEHMGEKYVTYNVKARQLKFFEENVNF
ncbi:NEK4, partial [Cervus elaphus hippelaphus]